MSAYAHGKLYHDFRELCYPRVGSTQTGSSCCVFPSEAQSRHSLGVVCVENGLFISQILDERFDGFCRTAVGKGAKGRKLVAAALPSEGDTFIWDLQTGRKLLNYEGKMVTSLAFHPSENRLVFGEEGGTVVVFTFNHDELNMNLQLALVFETGGEYISQIRWHLRHDLLLVKFRRQSFVQVWDAVKGLKLSEMTLPWLGQGPYFHPKKKELVTITLDKVIDRYDALSGSHLTRTKVQSPILSAIHSPCGKYLLTLHVGDPVLKVWDDCTMQLVHSIQEVDGYPSEVWFCEANNDICFVMTLTGSYRGDLLDRLYIVNFAKERKEFER